MWLGGVGDGVFLFGPRMWLSGRLMVVSKLNRARSYTSTTLVSAMLVP